LRFAAGIAQASLSSVVDNIGLDLSSKMDKEEYEKEARRLRLVSIYGFPRPLGGQSDAASLVPEIKDLIGNKKRKENASDTAKLSSVVDKSEMDLSSNRENEKTETSLFYVDRTGKPIRRVGAASLAPETLGHVRRVGAASLAPETLGHAPETLGQATKDLIANKKRKENSADTQDWSGDDVEVLEVNPSTNKRVKDAPGDDDGSDDDDTRGDDDEEVDMDHQITTDLKMVTRHIPPTIVYKARNHVISAVIALANAMDDSLVLEGRKVMGGNLVSMTRELLQNVSGPADFGKALFFKVNTNITKVLLPIYRFLEVKDPTFNVWVYGTTYPVVVLIPDSTYGTYQWQGFAVAQSWIYNAMGSACMELTHKNLAALGYFEKLSEEKENEDEGGQKLPGKKSPVELLEGNKDEVNNDCINHHVIEHNGGSYVIAKGVQHFAVMLNERSTWNHGSLDPCGDDFNGTPRRYVN
jgi:hypothetical protein